MKKFKNKPSWLRCERHSDVTSQNNGKKMNKFL